ncbi:MAG TPA: hypothetical protein VF753_15195 [Terriglobales bacterium]
MRTWLSMIMLCSVAALILSCGHGQILNSITVQPQTETFGSSTTPVDEDKGLHVQLMAVGNYLYPPGTKDLTSQVTWSSNTPQMVTVSPAGVITATGNACGATIITATTPASGSGSNAIVIGSMTANVVCFTGTGPELTVQFAAGSGTGSVTSSPAGLSCTGNPCAATFTTGQTVVLTAVPNTVFVGWSGCDIASGTACTVINLTENRTVTVTF